MTINEIQDEIIDEFSLFENQNDKYSYIIELGKMLEPINDLQRIEDNLIKGCQSKVWLASQFEGNQVLFFADSDSTLVKGLISLLVRVFSNQEVNNILASELYFIDKIGLHDMLSMNRSNGLAAMVKQMKMYALAYSAKLNS